MYEYAHLFMHNAETFVVTTLITIMIIGISIAFYTETRNK